MADTEDDTEETVAPAQPSGGTTTLAPAGPPAAAGPDFTAMVKPPSASSDIQAKLSEIQRGKSASDAKVADETTRRLEGDRARMEQAYKASAIMPDELTHPWDAKAKAAEHSTDPVTAFGSLGSAFAMLASSFARVPMSAALNAGAAAIDAVHAGDEKAYQREYESWKANTDLALKRHEIERQAYNDATNLMNSNINAGRTKMELAATKFGDQKAQALLDAGMDKELVDLLNSRNKTALDLQKQWDDVQLQHEKVTDLRNDPRYTSGDQAAKAAAIQDWNQRWAANGGQKLKYDAEADYIAAQKRANPSWTPDDMLKWKKDFATASEGEGKPGGPLSKPKQEAQEIDRRKADYVAQGLTEKDAYDRAVREVASAKAVPSGNRIDDINKQISMFDNGKQAIDRVLGAIDKHWRVGVAGYASRGAERLGNVIGSDATDASQVAHDIQYLQTIAPRLLTDSATGRPLSSEAAKINQIIAGLNIGDTTANTKRALSDIRALWDKMQQDNLARRNGTPNLPPPAGSPPAAGTPGTSSGRPKWETAPIVSPGPRSEAEGAPSYG